MPMSTTLFVHDAALLLLRDEADDLSTGPQSRQYPSHAFHDLDRLSALGVWSCHYETLRCVADDDGSVWFLAVGDFGVRNAATSALAKAMVRRP